MTKYRQKEYEAFLEDRPIVTDVKRKIELLLISLENKRLAKMTKYRQEEYLAFLEDRPIVTDVKVCTNRQEPPDMLTDRELVEVTAVFRAFETGLREATIYPKDLDKAMQALGLNPIEQDVIDLTIKVARIIAKHLYNKVIQIDGFIYFPDFCEVILEKYRLGKEGDEHFRQNLFKNLCGTEPFPTDFKAKKYRFDKHFLTKEEFKFVMKNLPAEVHDSEIEEMFAFADKDKDGKLSYEEFQIMINPPAPPEIPKPTLEEFNDFLARKALQEEQQENIQGGSNEYLAPSEQPINIFSMLSQYNPMNRRE